jgi:hypothetical protein
MKNEDTTRSYVCSLFLVFVFMLYFILFDTLVLYPWCGAWFLLFRGEPQSISLVMHVRCDIALSILPSWCARCNVW